MKSKSPLPLFTLSGLVAVLIPFASAQSPGAVTAGATSAPISGNSAAATAAALPSASASATTSTVTSNPAGTNFGAGNVNTAAATGNRTAAINASANNSATNSAVANSSAVINAAGNAGATNVGGTNNPAILNAGTPASTTAASAVSGSANANFNGVSNQTVDRSPLTLENTPGLSRTAVGPSPSTVAPTSTMAGMNPTMSSSSGMNLAASSSQMLQAINNSTRATRDTALNQVDTNMNLSTQAISDLRNSGGQLSGEARSRFEAAFENLQAQQGNLTRSLGDARRASDSDYITARAKLASDYQNYLQAYAQAQAAVQTQPAARSNSGMPVR